MNAPKSRRQYLAIDDSVYNSIAFRTLPGGALKLWVDLRTQFRGGNNGSLMVTLAVLKHRAWTSRSKLTRARDELLARGLIGYTRQCNKNRFHQASLVAFADLDIAANERHGVRGGRATHAYLTWEPEPKPAKCVVPKQGSNVSRNGTATVPESGQRIAKTCPESGRRQKQRKAAPVLDLSAIERPKGPLS